MMKVKANSTYLRSACIVNRSFQLTLLNTKTQMTQSASYLTNTTSSARNEVRDP